MNDNDIVRRTDIINRLLDRSKPLHGLIHVDDVIRTINVAPSVNPQEPCNDAISRQAAIDRLSHWYSDMLETNKEQEDLMEVINAIPSAEPKTGHWIYDRRREWDGECKYECSECGMGSDVDYAYCMRCGTKMVEPQEKRCMDCSHYGKLSLDCSRCDDDCSMFELQENEE